MLMEKLRIVRAQWLVIFVAYSPVALAQQPIERLATSAGILSVQSLTGTACEPMAECKAVVVGNRILAKDYYASIQAAYPSIADPRAVAIHTSTGGNACCWRTDLVDFTTAAPFVLSGMGEGQITYDKEGLQIDKITGRDAIGDEVWTLYRYVLGSGKIVSLQERTRYVPISSRANERYPSDILSDPGTRAPLLDLIGRGNYAAFRADLGLAGAVKTVGGRFVVASGCRPHACCLNSAAFVLDTAEHKAWALQARTKDCRPGTETAQMWGTLFPADAVPRRELEGWLAEKKIGWAKVSVNKVVDQTSALAPGTSPPQSPPAASARLLDGTIRVQMVRDAGTYEVPAQLNGALTLRFILDSGASDVSVPADVFGTLLRTGTITGDDLLGTAKYALADGTVKEGAVFRLRSLQVGSVTLENVRASVAEANGPLLLGMSFLGRFSSWSVDNGAHQLVLNR